MTRRIYQLSIFYSLFSDVTLEMELVRLLGALLLI